MVQAGQSEFDGMPPQTYICVDCAWDTEKRETIVYFWGKEFQRNAPENDIYFEQVQPWSWYVQAIFLIRVVGLLKNLEFYEVKYWRIFINNFMHKYSFNVNELLR